MAHWISSKLKAAENILQQIDQQAAESLGKNGKSASDNQFGLEDSPVVKEIKPLIKEQLKKKAPVYMVDQGIGQADKGNVNSLSRSDSDVKTGIPSYMNSKLKMIDGHTDGDWTKLLSAPDRKGVSETWGGSQTSIRASGITSLKRNGKKVGSYLRESNLSSEKIEKKMLHGVNGSSIVGFENNGANSNENEINVGEASPTASSMPFLNRERELDENDSASSTNSANVASIGCIKDTTDIVDQHKQNHFGKHTSWVIPSSRDLISTLQKDVESNSATSSDSEGEKEREEKRKTRQQILAVKTINERQNLVAGLEGEKQSLEKILVERAKQQVQEASELQTRMMETMEAVDLEKHNHNSTRMEAFARLAKLEAVNRDLSRSLANAQKNLEVEVDRITELRHQMHSKEAVHEELVRKISSTNRNAYKLRASKGVEFEMNMLEAEYSFINDKVGRMQDQARVLETNTQAIRSGIEGPTDVEIELKERLRQLTDLLIQKQAQVETLIPEKAMLLLKIETVSKLLDETKLMIDYSMRDDLESGEWRIPSSNLSPLLKERMRTSRRQFGSLVRQLDSLFCAGAVVLKSNWTARIWALVYLVCLHLWVVYILTLHSPPISVDS